MHPIKLSIHWHGAAQDYDLLLHIAPYIVAPALIYMVKLMIIGRNPTVRGWHDWRFDGEYDGYDTVGKAITVCIEQQEFLPEPWQWSITVVEFDCRVPEISFHPERLWLSELTYEEKWGGCQCDPIIFFGWLRHGK